MKRLYTQSVILLILCCNIFSPPGSYAQTGWQWGMTNLRSDNLGFDGWAVTTDRSGNVFAAGFTSSTTGPGILNYMVFGADTIYNLVPLQQQIVVKADSGGHILWARGSQEADCWPVSMVTDNGGNVYVFGTTFGYYLNCSFDTFNLPNPATYNMYYLVKYSPTGDVLWAKNVVGISGLSEIVGSMGIDDNNNVYVTGYFDFPSVTIGRTTLTNSDPAGSYDVFVAKYNSAGDPIWAKNFGGLLNESPTAMTVTPRGNIYITGTYYSRSMTIGSAILTDTLGSPAILLPMTFFVKMDSNGNFKWAQTLNRSVAINSLTNDGLENVYMAGSMDSGLIIGPDTLTDAGRSDLFIAKYDSSGNFTWANSAGGSGIDYGYSITIDNCRDLWVAGSSSSPFMLFNGHIFEPPTGGDPIFVSEYNDSGVYITSTGLSSGGDDYAGVVADNRGNFYIGGDFISSITVGPDALSSGSATEELLIAKYKYDTTVCPSMFLDTVYNRSDTTICGLSDTTYITLTPQTGIDYLWEDGTTASTYIAGTSGIYWVSFLSGYTFIVDTFYVTFARTSPPCPSPIVTGVNKILAGSADLSVYPNPASASLTVLSANQTINEVTITNLVGQTIYSQNYNAPHVQVDVSHLPPGLYFVKVNGSEVRRFVKE